MEIQQGAGGTRCSGLRDTLLFLEPQGQGSGSGRSVPLSVVTECLTCVGPCAEPWWAPWIQSGGQDKPDTRQGGPRVVPVRMGQPTGDS